jgi:hypothetical protein
VDGREPDVTLTRCLWQHGWERNGGAFFGDTHGQRDRLY